MNAWLLYRTKIHADLKEQEPDNRMSRQQGELSKIIAEMWRKEDPATKQVYERLAQDAKREHKEKYPDYKFAPLPKEKKASKSRSVTPSSSGLARTPSGRTVYDHPQWLQKRASASSLAASDRFDYSNDAGQSNAGASVLPGSVEQLASSVEVPYRAAAHQAQTVAPGATPADFSPRSSSSSLPIPLIPPPSQYSYLHHTTYEYSHSTAAAAPQLYDPVRQPSGFPAEPSQRAYRTHTPAIPLLPPSAFSQSYQLSRRHTVSNNYDLYSYAPPVPPPSPFPLINESQAAPSQHYEHWNGPTSNPLPSAQSHWPASAPLTTSPPAPSYFHPQEHHLPPPPPPQPHQSVPGNEWEGVYMTGGLDYIYPNSGQP